MTFSPAWILADGEWVGVIIFLVISALSALAQGLGNKKKKAPGPRPGPQPPRQAPAPGLRDEIEAFLKAQRGDRRPAADEPPVEAIVIDEENDFSGMRSSSAREAKTTICGGVSRSDGDDDLSDVDSRHLPHLRQAPEPGADPTIDGSERDIVDAPGPATSSEQIDEISSPLASQLTAMLQSPQGAFQAILLSEIFRRPDERPFL
ncbi:hypothetical protein JCM19992_06280 [Thermostilla marina]